MRFTHEGQWYPTSGPGFAVFDSSKYDNTAGAAPFTGMVWHQTDSSIPQSGFPSKLFFIDPRVGFAWDTRGDGKTVWREGFRLRKVTWVALWPLPTTLPT